LFQFSTKKHFLASPFIFAKQQFTIDSLPPLFEKTGQQQKSLQPERLKIRGIAQHYETKQHSILPLLNNNNEKGFVYIVLFFGSFLFVVLLWFLFNLGRRGLKFFSGLHNSKMVKNSNVQISNF